MSSPSSGGSECSVLTKAVCCASPGPGPDPRLRSTAQLTCWASREGSSWWLWASLKGRKKQNPWTMRIKPACGLRAGKAEISGNSWKALRCPSRHQRGGGIGRSCQPVTSRGLMRGSRGFTQTWFRELLEVGVRKSLQHTSYQSSSQGLWHPSIRQRVNLLVYREKFSCQKPGRACDKTQHSFITKIQRTRKRKMSLNSDICPTP